MPISISQKNCLQMAESHELCKYPESLQKNQKLHLNGLDKWANPMNL